MIGSFTWNLAIFTMSSMVRSVIGMVSISSDKRSSSVTIKNGANESLWKDLRQRPRCRRLGVPSSNRQQICPEIRTVFSCGILSQAKSHTCDLILQRLSTCFLEVEATCQ